MELSNNAAITLAAALAAGVIALTLARHLRTPGIILLLGMGVSLGPDVLGWIDPKSLGDMLMLIVGMAVAVILFEGGLQLEIKRLKNEGKVINRLITVGAVVTAALGSVSAMYFMNWNWQLSALFGTLVIVTGPTVVTPLLKKLRVNRKLQTILEAEGVLIDPVGAIIAVVALDFVMSSSIETAAINIGMLFAKLSFGFVVGSAGGFLVGWLLKQENLVPEELENILTLAMVLLLFEASNAVMHESGIMTVTIAGVVVGNMKIPMHRQLVEFKEQLTAMLIGILFVLLAADVRIADLEALGLPGALTVIAVMVIVRPINIFLSTLGSNLSFKEKLFMSWLAPRGIVAAAVASLFAINLDKANIDGGSDLRALVFLVIVVTVVLQGFSAGPLAMLLGLRRKTKDGYLIVGANPLGRTLARHLKFGDEEIVMIDRNASDCQAAVKEGYRVIYGNALEEQILQRSGLESRRAVLAVTPNEGVNLMMLKRAKEVSKDPHVFMSLVEGSGVSAAASKESTGGVLFGSQIHFDLWSHRLKTGLAYTLTWEYTGDKPIALSTLMEEDPGGQVHASFLPLVSTRKGGNPFPAHDGLLLRNGDKLTLLEKKAGDDELGAWLEEKGFKKVLDSEGNKDE